jgi:hypothetical protein
MNRRILALGAAAAAAAIVAQPAAASPASPAPAAAQAATLAEVLNELIGLCTQVRDTQAFGAKARELGWKYDLATGQRARDLPFGRVVLQSDSSHACVIAFTLAAGRGAEVPAAVEKWARTGDPKADVTRGADGAVQVAGRDYRVHAEAGSGSSAIVRVTLY